MDFKSKIIKTKYIHQLQDPECYPEKSSDSLQTTIIDSKITSSTLSPNKSRRSIQKKVIIVPINDGDCSRVKGDMSAPPSDSWAWRKYGQKPIKGSPFPRGYYKCSSSKGCPARKQVEKSREDPNMLVLVYYSDHNHPCPPPRKSNNQNKLCKDDDDEEQDEDFQKLTNHVIQSDHNIDDTNFTFTGMAASEGPFITNTRANDHGSCFSDYDDGVYSTTMLDQVPFFTFDEMTTMYTIRHEDEAIFADLDELPECSTVFHRRKMEIDEERRRQNLIS